MQERRTLMSPCEQAASFERIFRDADPVVLKQEIDVLHKSCEEQVTIVSQEVIVTCTCNCHLLAKYRRILDSIHALGNIYYDRGRLEAYKIVALKASEERRGWKPGERCWHWCDKCQTHHHPEQLSCGVYAR